MMRHKSLFVLRQIQNTTVWAERTVVKIFNLLVYPVTSRLYKVKTARFFNLAVRLYQLKHEM
jgi:hypothetical protein